MGHATDQPRTPTMSPADKAAHESASHIRSNPAAALYRQAAAAYEAAARDADKLGAHTRADNHRQAAAEHRALATTYNPTAQDDDPNAPWLPKIPRPRPGATLSDVCPLCEYFRCRCNGVQPGNAHLTRATAGAR